MIVIITSLTLMVFWKKRWIFTKDFKITDEDNQDESDEKSNTDTKKETRITRMLFKK